MPRGSAQAHQQISGVQTFGTILPDLTIESIRNPDHPKRLFLHIWDGRKYATAPATSDGGRTHTRVNRQRSCSRCSFSYRE